MELVNSLLERRGLIEGYDDGVYMSIRTDLPSASIFILFSPFFCKVFYNVAKLHECKSCVTLRRISLFLFINK